MLCFHSLVLAPAWINRVSSLEKPDSQSIGAVIGFKERLLFSCELGGLAVYCIMR